MSSSLTTTPTKSPMIARSVENDYQTALLIPNTSESNSKYSSSLTNDSYLGSSIHSLTTTVSSSPNQNQLSTNGSFSFLTNNIKRENSDSETHSLINFKSHNDNNNKTKSRNHPNIHHRPAIYKHHHRPSLSNTLSNSNNNTNSSNTNSNITTTNNNNDNNSNQIINDRGECLNNNNNNINNNNNSNDRNYSLTSSFNSVSFKIKILLSL